MLTITGSTYMYQTLYLKRDPMYVFLNLKFMYQVAGAVLSLSHFFQVNCAPQRF